MIRSMTAFGKATAAFGGKKMEVEIRSLNSKNPDIGVKLPLGYRDKEMDIRALLTEALERGKIDLVITVENGTGETSIGINKELALSYVREFRKLSDLTGQQLPVDYVTLLSRIPEIMKTEQEDPDPAEWEELRKLVVAALNEADLFRLEEGKILEADLAGRIVSIRSLLSEVESFEGRRLEVRRAKLRKALAELAEQADPDRFEQEMIYYLEKMDFTEEKVRLVKHLDFFMQTLSAEDSQGRKLNFIGQEIGREINTLGAKANDADIQQLVVRMKDELEKIKEQLGNIL